MFFELKFSLKFINIERVKKIVRKVQTVNASQIDKTSEIGMSDSEEEREGIQNESTVGDFGKGDVILKDLNSVSQTFIENDPKPSLL
jgi:hypothetical protein